MIQKTRSELISEAGFLHSKVGKEMAIKLIVGLGNPGTEYSETRHNAGFWFVEALAQQNQAQFKQERRFHGLLAKIRQNTHDVYLLKPMTYMNRSGLSVVALALYYKILPEEILVVHDELDLIPGQNKLKFGGSAAGHNGLKDISAHLNTQQYWRLRVGIGHPRQQTSHPDVSQYVLKPPQKEEQHLIDLALEKAYQMLPLIIEGQFEQAMMQLHQTP